jgi:hypothetical protein
VLEAARRVASEFGLESEWLNEKANAAGYVTSFADGPLVFQAASLIVRAASIEHLLAMKIAAWCDQADIDDALTLLSRLRATDVEMVWALIGGYVPLDKRPRGRDNLFEAWDVWTSEHGSP